MSIWVTCLKDIEFQRRVCEHVSVKVNLLLYKHARHRYFLNFLRDIGQNYFDSLRSYFKKYILIRILPLNLKSKGEK